MENKRMIHLQINGGSLQSMLAFKQGRTTEFGAPGPLPPAKQLTSCISTHFAMGQREKCAVL
jgi:hypothetical protein